MVFLGGGVAKQEGDRRSNDRGVEEVELEFRQFVTPERSLAEPLDNIKEGGEDNADTPAIDPCIGVNRTEPAEGQIRREIKVRFDHLEGDNDSNQYRNQSPDQAPDDKAAHNGVVVVLLLHSTS